ncbi:MAG: hypothetical protein UY18_C0024G0010 [Microgenomates group bacterium GW2011_GWF2_47_9]|nr:MAG: hypothetical protein UY18_C0024G0010 [Microgenomates group bacterium GW2011_GWF2_47_9]
MAIAINLLKNRHTLSERDYQKEQKYFQTALILVVVVVVLSLAVSIWRYLLIRRLSSVEVRAANATRQLAGLTTANASQVYLKSRLKLISSFLDDRTIARQAFQRVFSLDIPGAVVTSASFVDDTKLSMQVQASNVLTLSSVVDYFSEDTGFFIQVVSGGVTRQADGKYQVDLLLTIPKGS